MEVVLEIKDSKADTVLDLLKDLSYVKIKSAGKAKSKKRPAAYLEAQIKEAVEEMKLIHAGKKTGRPLEEFLNEL